MYLIGLTGGIASGKSTVSKMLSELGAYIIDADKLAREVTRPGKPAWHDIVGRFGTGIIGENDEIDRKLLGKIVFNDSDARADLEQITHPRIKAEVEAEVEKAVEAGYSTAVLDVPLLIETGWHSLVQSVWVVFVDEKTQVERLMARDNIDYDSAMARINAQLSLTEKIKYANVIINNSTSIDSTRNQVLDAWKVLG